MLKRIDEMIDHMDEPIGDPGFLPVLELSHEMRKHAKVVLTGDGGDELFAGYDRYKLFKYGLVLRNFLPSDFGNDILRRVRNMRGKSDYEAFIEAIRLFDEKELKRLNVKQWDASNDWKSSHDSLWNAQRFDLNTVVPEDFFMKTDKMGSACSLEMRTPFFDHRVVEIAFSLPRDELLKGFEEKRILKKAFADLLPKSTLRRRKQGFNVPIDAWFAGPLNSRLKRLLKNSKHGLYDKEYVLELLDRAKNPHSEYRMNWDLAQKLWSILVFELWYEKVFS
jgi:asparagine synthase (glutamine-hydrolysing)